MCDECWLDVAMDQQHHKFKAAKDGERRAWQPLLRLVYRRARGSVKSGQRVLTPSRPSAGAATTQLVHQHRRGSQAPPGPDRQRLNGTDIVVAGVNSVCLICAHIFYGVSMPRCSRCGGAIHIASDPDLQAMARHSMECMNEDVFQ